MQRVKKIILSLVYTCRLDYRLAEGQATSDIYVQAGQ